MYAMNSSDFANYVKALAKFREGRITKLEAALRDLLDDLAQLEGSGPFVISREFCQVNRERAELLLADDDLQSELDYQREIDLEQSRLSR